jgi:translation initiation factor IF-2
MDRYCDDKKEWKTRGFSLEVIMDHRRIPDLLVALSNIEGWPVNILRVHVADYKDEDLVAAGVPGGDNSRMRGMMMPPTPDSRGPAAGHIGGKAGMGAPPRMPMTTPRQPIPRGSEDGFEGPVNTRDPLDDPNLATVAIVGVIYIFKRPPPVAPAAPSPGAAPGGTAPGTTAPAAETPEATAADPAEPAEEMPEKSEAPAAAGDTTDEPDEAPPATPEGDSTDKAKPAASGKNGAGDSK